MAYSRIDVEALYGPLALWAIQQWQNPGHTLYLALDTTMLWNRFCVVAVSVVAHGRAIPLLWQERRLHLRRGQGVNLVIAHRLAGGATLLSD